MEKNIAKICTKIKLYLQKNVKKYECSYTPIVLVDTNVASIITRIVIIRRTDCDGYISNIQYFFLDDGR